MTTSPKASPITNVSDTARWVAVYRAMESERPDALFRDPFARRLAGASGEEIVAALRRGRAMAWAMIVRTQVIDELLQQCIARDGVDCVVNLAAGLDARPWRLALPSTLRWIDVDLPDILQYKVDALKDERLLCRYEAVKVDLTDGAARGELLARIGRESKRLLVITEGLLIYLTPEQVRALALDLHATPGLTSWITDLASPRLLRMVARSWGNKMAQAPILFGPAEGTAFFATCGWREAEYRSSMDEARRLHREMPLAGLWRVIGRLYPARTRAEFQRMSGIVLLQRLP